LPQLKYFLPSGLTPKRKPKNPMLVPKPFFETVALMGPKFFDLRQRQVILFFLQFNYIVCSFFFRSLLLCRLLDLKVTFLSYPKVAIFTTNVDAENQTLINHKCVCGA
jgi:hypothetical protein